MSLKHLFVNRLGSVGDGRLLGIGTDDYMWDTAKTSTNLSADDLDKLHDGRKTLFRFTAVDYQDGGGKYEFRSCEQLQPPNLTIGLGQWPVTWATCMHYNEIVKLP